MQYLSVAQGRHLEDRGKQYRPSCEKNSQRERLRKSWVFGKLLESECYLDNYLNFPWLQNWLLLVCSTSLVDSIFSLIMVQHLQSAVVPLMEKASCVAIRTSVRDVYPNFVKIVDRFTYTNLHKNGTLDYVREFTYIT